MTTRTGSDGGHAVPDASNVGGVLLEVEGLCVEYIGEKSSVRACTDVSFVLRRGEILGIAGESGSGKSTLITALTRLQRPPALTTAGRIIYHPRAGEPVDLAALSERELRRYRWTSLSIVLQSAMNALNPMMRLGDQFVDVLRTHDRALRRAAALDRARELLTMVGIPADRSRAYPHELSGGMRQRATIALALACGPDLVVMDEPTTAVDVVMQRQILAQILRLQREFGFAVIFVTHDLPLLLELAGRIAVMYAGRIVENAAAEALYNAPRHPYTRGLRDAFPPLHASPPGTPGTPGAAMPGMSGREGRLSGIPGSPPDLREPGAGCAFEPRCARRLDGCADRRPELTTDGDGHQVACLLHESHAAIAGADAS